MARREQVTGRSAAPPEATLDALVLLPPGTDVRRHTVAGGMIGGVPVQEVINHAHRRWLTTTLSCDDDGSAMELLIYLGRRGDV